MKKLLFSFLLPLFTIWVSAQVPAGQDEAALPQPGAGANAQEESFVGSLFSDPSEIENIEGLDEPLERVRLRDQDTNLILDMIQTITGRYILRPQNLPQVKINFDSMSVLTRRETLLALESLLAMNGIGITKIDSQFFKAVPATGMNVHVPIWLEAPAATLPPSQRIYVKMFYLKYIPAEKMREILNPFATPNVSSLLIFPNANTIMITDSLVNLQRMEKIIEKTDYSKDESSFILEWYFPQRFSAEVLREEFESKYEAFFKNDFHIKPEFTVPESNDQLGIHCHTLDKDRILEILNKIDVKMLNPVKNDLIELYHASSESVAKTLESFLDFSSSSTVNTKGKTPSSPASKSGSAGSNAGAGTTASEMMLSPFAKIISDKRSNGVFISGTQADLDILTDMIKKLDTPLPMARIDTIFVMVDLSANKARGIDALFQDLYWTDDSRVEERYLTEPGLDKIIDTPDDITTKISDTIGGKNLEGSIGIPGINSKITFDMQKGKIKEVSWGQIFSLASQRKDVRIFSTPSITVIHGGGEDSDTKGSGKSKIQIMDTRSIGLPRYYDGSRPNPASQEEPNQLTNRTAKTELSIQNPRIRKTVRDENGKIQELGTIFMSVAITAEKFDETKTNVFEDQEIPSIKTRYAETDLAIRDRQIMVLGGLQEVQLDKSEAKYNFLSSIPYFGEKLFSPKNEKYTPTELLIFIRPRILDPEDSNDNLTELNTRTIDSMMNPNYEPRFESPSGKILGEIQLKESTSRQDKASSKPSL